MTCLLALSGFLHQIKSNYALYAHAEFPRALRSLSYANENGSGVETGGPNATVRFGGISVRQT